MKEKKSQRPRIRKSVKALDDAFKPVAVTEFGVSADPKTQKTDAAANQSNLSELTPSMLLWRMACEFADVAAGKTELEKLLVFKECQTRFITRLSNLMSGGEQDDLFSDSMNAFATSYANLVNMLTKAVAILEENGIEYDLQGNSNDADDPHVDS